jgi:hypothetical protein
LTAPPLEAALPSASVSGDISEEDAALPLSERVERSTIGQILISGAIAVVILGTIGTHLPASAVSQSVGERSNQLTHAMGLEQAWGVFAPDPRSSSLDLEALVTFADGSTDRWTVPEGNVVVGNLRYYRWRKWLERVRSDDYSRIWDQTARWIAREFDDPDNPVVQVDLIRFFRDNSLDDPQPPYENYTFYVLELGSER